MKVLVGLSGGVDSAVTALLLKEQGHEVIGATMSIWKDDGFSVKTGYRKGCYSPDEVEDIELARQLADFIEIPFYVINCADEFDNAIMSDFKTEYINGRTPNPCIKCNAKIKFGLFPKLAKESGIVFDKFATGHYARIEKNENGRYLLKKGIVPKKDQSYFLYRLTQAQLENILMPLGNFTKENIRNIAKENGLKVSEKPDSQDFYNGNYNELLQIKPIAGNIVTTDGKILGTHNGIWNYTIGQRKGLGVSASEALYVLELKKATNEVVVGFADKTFNEGLIAVDTNWIALDNLSAKIECTAKIRSTQQPVEVLISPDKNNSVKVAFKNPQKSVAQGQSVVFYDDDIVLGGGIIDSAF